MASTAAGPQIRAGHGADSACKSDIAIYGNAASSDDASNDFLAGLADHQGDLILTPP